MKRLSLLAALCLSPVFAAQAQTVQMPVGKLQIPPAQAVMLQAAQKVMQRDYAGALALYDRAIALDGGNIEAYIQRSVVKREIHDAAGSSADAAVALRLCDAGLAATPQNAELYHERSMALRLLKDYPHARENLRQAMALPGAQARWQNDLAAIDLDEKFNGE